MSQSELDSLDSVEICSSKEELPRTAIGVDSRNQGQDLMGPSSFLASGPDGSSLWGFLSFPEPGQRSQTPLLLLWPQASAVPGCGFEGHQGPFDALLDRPTKEAPLVTQGLGPGGLGRGWAELAEAIPMWPQETAAEAQAPQNMAMACPTHSSVHNCPSPPPVDGAPDMVSLSAPAPRSPRVPRQPRAEAFPRRPPKDGKTLDTLRLASALRQDEDTVAMAPSCPRLAASPGFPSAGV